MRYYLAIDIGASSGRHILGCISDGKIQLEEIYRFENGMKKVDGHLTWDVEELYSNVVAGIKECAKRGKIPYSVAIDTWGVDYVLLDDNLNELLPVYAYRDSRTDGVPQKVDSIIPRKKLYERTGIQTQNFNTIYQLMCDKESGRLDKAAHILLMPEYLSYRLSGVIANEYTICSTGGLINAESKDWDHELIDMLGFDRKLFKPISESGTVLGNMKPDLAKEVGFDTKIVLAAGHDTASAIAAIPIDEGGMYISSGTWSLVGIENKVPVTTDAALNANLTNEGGVEYRYRFLKNIMGMWLFQNIRKELNKKYTYDEMMQMAMESKFTQTVDVTDSCFNAPDSMIDAFKTKLGMPELEIGDLLSCVYHSLAASYKKCVEQIEQLSGNSIPSIQIVGGGSKDRYLNSLTSKYTGKPVYTGLTEATALGNLLVQIMSDQGINLTRARDIVRDSFNIKEAESI